MTADSPSGRPTRWVTDTDDNHSHWYIERFRKMASEGADLEGEARLINAMVGPASRVLDAGCGPGRLGGALHRWGHDVVGVDADADLIAAARDDHPGPTWMVADLAQLSGTTTAELGPSLQQPFDAAVLAGNVIAFVAPGTEAAVLANVANLVKAGGPIVVGFHPAKLDPQVFEDAVGHANLVIQQRFATWTLDPWTSESDFLLVILRNR